MDIILNEEKAVMANVLGDTTAVAPQMSPESTVGGADFPWQRRAAGFKVFVVQNKTCGYMCTSFKGARRKQRDQPQDAGHASSMCFVTHEKIYMYCLYDLYILYVKFHLVVS